MPCYTRVRKGVTAEQRKQQVKDALKKLEASLLSKRAKLVVGSNGAVAITGWEKNERDDVTDVCAVRTLMAQNSWAFRQALASAEALAGRKMNQQAVTAGVHSHDSGKTWDPGH
jgi:hypothetical protein